MSFTDTVRKRMQKFLQQGPEKSTEYKPGDLDKGARGVLSQLSKSYYDSLRGATRRIARYKEYKYLDVNLAEASASLNIYADNIVSGAIGGAENYNVVIDEDAPIAEKAIEVVKSTEKRTGIKDDIWDIARDTICFGDDWEEIVITKDNGNFVVDRLKCLPPETIAANVDDRGVWKNRNVPYVQKTSIIDEKGIPFDSWRIIHFKLGRKIYGVDRSLFSNASRRIGRQLLWVDDSMVLARLSRAYMRYVFMVDTSKLNLEDKMRFAEEFLQRVKRKMIADRTSGRLSPIEAPWMPDEDIAIPTEKDSPQSVKALGGDMNMGKIDDVKYFQEKFFMALNIPKAYASKEEGVRAKATITQLDVQFARQVRRKQQALKPGLKQFYKTAFYLADIDPNSFEWNIVFPVLATMDEALLWEMHLAKAKIAKIYSVDIGVLNNTWIMQKLLNFSKDEIEKYSLIAPTKPGIVSQTSPQLSPELASMIQRDPLLRQALDSLKDMAGWQMDNQKEREDKIAVDDVKREGELFQKFLDWQEDQIDTI